MRFEPDPNFERLKTALMGGVPDRVPIAEVTVDEGVKESFLDRKVNNLETDIEFYVRAGYDFITLGRRLAGYPPLYPAAKLENYYDVQRAIAYPTMKGTISSRDDYENYPWIKPEMLDFRIIDKAEGFLPPSMKVIRFVGPIFQMTWMLMGFENMCYALADDPELVSAIMDQLFEIVHFEVKDALQREIVGAIWYVDDIAMKDRLMISPDFLRQYFFPKLTILGTMCRERDVPFIYHTDGDVSDVLTDIIDAGVNTLHPIDPTAMDIYEVKQQVAGKLCVIGNVDVHLLLTGKPDEVATETEKQIRCLAPGGGYVLGSSNSITRTVPPENYKAFLETARRVGTYPIE
jgi:uroporphyrinogen decarboxylase